MSSIDEFMRQMASRHEAAHVVVTLHLGHGVEYAKVLEHGQGRTRIVGALPMFDNWLLTLAGPAAESLFRDKRNWMLSPEITSVRYCLRQLSGPVGSREVFRTLLATVRRIFRRRHDALERISEALFTRGELNAAELLELFAGGAK